MDYLGISRFINPSPRKKEWWEMEWGDPGPAAAVSSPDSDIEEMLGPAPVAPSPTTMRSQLPPPRGLLDRIADRMSDLGYGGGEEERRAALRRAMGAFGGRLAAGAMKEGLGGLGAAASEGFSAYEGGLAEQRKRRDEEEEIARKVEGDRTQQEYMGALTDQMRGKGEEEARRLREAVEARQAMVAERRAYLETLEPDKRARLAPLVGADPDQWNRYVYELGEPPKPAEPDRRSVGGDLVEIGPDGVKVLYRSPREPREPREPGAPTTRDFPDGTERQWNPGTQSWDVIARKPEAGVTFDQRAEAEKIYREALGNREHAAHRRGTGPDSAFDPKATWKAAYEMAGLAAPPPAPRVNSTNDARNDAPQANHVRNEALAALRRGAPEAAVLAELRKAGKVGGFTPEQILASAKRLMGQL